jgi:hypothetical protein
LQARRRDSLLGIPRSSVAHLAQEVESRFEGRGHPPLAVGGTYPTFAYDRSWPPADGGSRQAERQPSLRRCPSPCIWNFGFGHVAVSQAQTASDSTQPEAVIAPPPGCKRLAHSPSKPRNGTLPCRRKTKGASAPATVSQTMNALLVQPIPRRADPRTRSRSFPRPGLRGALGVFAGWTPIVPVLRGGGRISPGSLAFGDAPASTP